MADMVEAFAARRVRMMEILDGYKQFGLDYVKPEGAFYVMLVCDKFYGKSLGDKKIEGSMDFAMELLAAQKVAATPAYASATTAASGFRMRFRWKKWRRGWSA